MSVKNRAGRAGDRLVVHGLQFVGKHGVYEHERAEGRRFRVDLEVVVDTDVAARSDDLDDALDYRSLAASVLDVGQGPSHHLIESLAEAIAERLLADQRVGGVELALRKYADGVPGDPEWVGITISRWRSQA
jgi:dihydroneopterin aldolase